jgi:hypothetical protein
MESTTVEATTDNLANASPRAHRHAFSSFVYAPVPVRMLQAGAPPLMQDTAKRPFS